MKKILIILLTLSLAFAGEGLPVLTLPSIAQDGYLPSSPVKTENGITFSYANWYLASDYSAISVELNGYEMYEMSVFVPDDKDYECDKNESSH